MDGVPFAMAGQGLQAVVKTSLAVSGSTSSDAFVLVEEPENHLSHTTLTRLLAAIERLGEGRQTIVATHSSFVLNRLGLDRLVLMTAGRAAVFDDIPIETVRFFQRLSGYDTLRLVLARKVVLVEGPSDDLVFSRFYLDATGRRPQDDSIDVISMHGVSLKRSLQLAAAMDRQLIALRDNDGTTPEHWTAPLADYLEDGRRELFIGDPDDGKTLEPQLEHVNTDATLRQVLGLDGHVDPVAWMTSNKTEAALRIAESEATLAPPQYIADAIQALQ